MKVSWPKGLLPGAKRLLGRYQYVLLVIAVGILLLLLPLGSGGGRRRPPSLRDSRRRAFP